MIILARSIYLTLPLLFNRWSWLVFQHGEPVVGKHLKSLKLKVCFFHVSFSEFSHKGCATHIRFEAEIT